MKSLSALLLMAAFTACASVTAETCDRAALAAYPRYIPGGNISPPKVIRRLEPIASDTLRRQDRRVIATVEAVVNERGIPTQVCFISGDMEWGAALANAVRNWTFEPAMSDGKPIAVRFSVTSSFSAR
jgi:hypothetical protein